MAFTHFVAICSDGLSFVIEIPYWNGLYLLVIHVGTALMDHKHGCYYQYWIIQRMAKVKKWEYISHQLSVCIKNIYPEV